MRIALAAGFVALMSASLVLASDSSSKLEGAGTCKKCHQAAFEAWEDSLHNRAHQALPKAHKEDPRCVRCHGTGESMVSGVQCESCHGSGMYYARRYVMKDRELARIVGLVDVAEKTCQRCHTESTPSIQSFDFKRLWEVIAHGQDEKKPETASK